MGLTYSRLTLRRGGGEAGRGVQREEQGDRRVKSRTDWQEGAG